MNKGRFGPLVGAIDEGTSSARFLVFAAETAEVLTFHQVSIKNICEKEGWVEQDPKEVLKAVYECIEKTVDNMRRLDIDPSDIVAIGITNQRETTIVWDNTTGEPLYNAIVWSDIRNIDTVDKMLSKLRDKNAEYFKPLCGLPISTYFSALKLRWLMDNVPEVKQAIDSKKCYFGTMDSWLIWNLTGGVSNGLHVTDVTNASRTMLMNIKTLNWEPALYKFFEIPVHILPAIRSSSEIYGFITEGPLQNIPISGCLGDQQSALVGQMCLKQGQAKNTYGTGCFLLYNTGTAMVISQHGLLTTIGYRMGPNAPIYYALEGSVAVGGVSIRWLRDNLQILSDASDSEKVAKKASKTGEVYFVPAFSGLYAPYWRKDARSVICGLTEETTKNHLVKAALEAVCFQTTDIIEAMNKDCGGAPLTKLLVDGGMAANNYLMQLQADLSGVPVIRPQMTETTALGAAVAAGSAEGIGVWDLSNIQPVPSDTFYPSISLDEREIRYSRWKMAIKRSLGWDLKALPVKNSCLQDKINSIVPISLFAMASVGMLVLATYNQ
nr:PREDICTED: glycerol kinase-like isoform X1 [Bemisia tabaci]XP_018914334.1 PREDICTED: glycerol kinase-like isoform X1 [Bemisia tabaci]XP_018914335.1 PREDICTED: glycerol kinase-like isoform X1 [Bemisia tabaci]XP_018914336.1 PREDICTED: glycerol kinase-like isoform X1 [Bemisia tabaci]